MRHQVQGSGIETVGPPRQFEAGNPGDRAAAPRRWAAAVAAALAGVVVLAACGGGSGGGGSGSGGGSDPGGSSQNDPAKFAQCMRSHGVPSFPDPNGNGQFSIKVTKGGALDPNSTAYKTALRTCQKYDTNFGNSNGGSGSSSAALKFAKCMRSHGVTNFPDPRPGGGLIMGGNVQSNPHFNSAIKACRPLLSGGGS